MLTMKKEYDFDTLVERRDTASYKWDSDHRRALVPLWVADMDFKTAPEIIAALRERVEHGVFGYTRVPDEYYEALINWFRRRHDWTIDRDWVIYVPGVVPALSAIIKALTVAGDKVIVQTPVYNCFFSSIRNNGCEVSENPLIYRDQSYVMDFDDLEARCADTRAKLLLLCNPANPAGRVWTPAELRRLGDICMAHGVTVIADEIHCELVYPGYRYTPYASLGDEYRSHSVTCVSPSKAFNTAGLQIANIIAPDGDMRGAIDRAVNINEVCDVNPFGVCGLIAAYDSGEAWLHELIAYLWDNYRFMCEFCEEFMPEFKLCRLEGTYLVWMDCTPLGMDSDELGRRLLDDESLWLNDGLMYGAAGNGFMRWNIATPRVVLTEGLNRFAAFVRAHRARH